MEKLKHYEKIMQYYRWDFLRCKQSEADEYV